MKLSSTFVLLAAAAAVQPATSRNENACGKGNGVSVVTVSGGIRRGGPPPYEGLFPYDDGNWYDFGGSLDDLDCNGRVDFKAVGALGPAHPFKLCVGGIVDDRAMTNGCGTECFEYQVGEGLENDGDCTSVNVAGRELWYVCTRDGHDMYNRLC
ncbi:hypothetical protein ACHAXT_008459 [Thalassiosira profunda]